MILKNLLQRIYNNQFFKDVSTLTLGTVISQVVVVLTSLLLARLFSVSDFGVLSVFTSFTVFFAVISTGRYELAIVLPYQKQKAERLLALILKIGFCISILYLLLIIFLKNGLGISDRTGFLTESTSYFAPLYIFFIAVYSGLTYWLQRHKNYKKITVANALQSVSAALLSIGFGVLHISSGMIYSLIIGIFIAIFYILLSEKEILKIPILKIPIYGVAKEYKSFPRYMTFSDLSLAASQQFIPILFAALYSTSIAGFYGMANKLIRLPNIMITSAIANVFRNNAIEEIRENGNCRKLYISTFKKLIVMSLPIYFIIFIASPKLFSVFLGVEWETAGIYARIISLFLFLEFIATPLNTLFYVREKQKILMRLQVVNAVVGAIMIVVGAKYFHSTSWSLILYSINALIFNSFFIYGSYRIAKS